MPKYRFRMMHRTLPQIIREVNDGQIIVPEGVSEPNSYKCVKFYRKIISGLPVGNITTVRLLDENEEAKDYVISGQEIIGYLTDDLVKTIHIDFTDWKEFNFFQDAKFYFFPNEDRYKDKFFPIEAWKSSAEVLRWQRNFKKKNLFELNEEKLEKVANLADNVTYEMRNTQIVQTQIFRAQSPSIDVLPEVKKHYNA